MLYRLFFIKRTSILSVLIIAALPFFYKCSVNSEYTLTVYSDVNSIKNPDTEFLSLEEAVEAAKTKSGNCIIMLANGSHFLTKTILLDSLNNNLVITAQKGAKPILYGGKKINSWKKEGKFFVADVHGLDFRLLEVNGRCAERSRMPESGTFDHLSVFKMEWASTSEGGFGSKPDSEQLLKMKYKPEDIDPIRDLDNTEITLYHSWDETLLRVASDDRKKHEVTFSMEPALPAGAFRITKYVVWNSKYPRIRNFSAGLLFFFTNVCLAVRIPLCRISPFDRSRSCQNH